MKNIIKTVALSLTLAASVFAATPAEACGGYGSQPVNRAERRAEAAVRQTTRRYDVQRFITATDVTLLDEHSGIARLTIINGKTLDVGLVKGSRGTWRLVEMRHLAQHRANRVAAERSRRSDSV